MRYFTLSYGDSQPWIATLGSIEKHELDPTTGEENYSEKLKVRNYLADWRPGKAWIDQPITLHFQEPGRKRYKTDRLFNGVVGPMFSERAVDTMGELLERDGHILPLTVTNSEERFYLWWVPMIENSLDLEKSEKFQNGRAIRKFAFNHANVRDARAFRPHYPGIHQPEADGNVIVSECFQRQWTDMALTGIHFRAA